MNTETKNFEEYLLEELDKYSPNDPFCSGIMRDILIYLLNEKIKSNKNFSDLIKDSKESK